MSTKSEKARKIGELHRKWVTTAKYTSLPVDGPSQYPETEEDVHTDPSSDAEFMSAMRKILDEPDTPEQEPVSRLSQPPVFEIVGHVEERGEAS